MSQPHKNKNPTYVRGLFCLFFAIAMKDILLNVSVVYCFGFWRKLVCHEQAQRVEWWARLDSNQRPIGYAYHLQLSLLLSNLWPGLSLYPKGYLPYSLYTFPTIVGLGSGLPRQNNTINFVRGFPEFDRKSPKDFSLGSP
ncbi:MAG: hypothetical protein PHT36_00645 [Patescibacteria group bacterium]|nr:hypothetical protein [Patescibacteria group bacterium]